MTPQDWKAVTTIRPPKPPPGYFSLLATGEEPVEEIFRKAQCIVCHVIPGIPDATGSVGPALNMKSAALIRLNPHYSRALLLQSRIRRCDRPGRRSAALGREASFVKREAQGGQSVSVSLHARYALRRAQGVPSLSRDASRDRLLACYQLYAIGHKLFEGPAAHRVRFLSCGRSVRLV